MYYLLLKTYTGAIPTGISVFCLEIVSIVFSHLRNISLHPPERATLRRSSNLPLNSLNAVLSSDVKNLCS